MFPFFDYRQTPACGYSIEYTLSVLKLDRSGETLELTEDNEGENTSPPFIVLDSDFITILP